MPTAVDTAPDRSSSTLQIHTAYAYLTGLLLTLIGMKYQGSNTNPFKEHSAIMILILIAMFVYVIALLTFQAGKSKSNHSPILRLCLCHISGALACELLVLILVAPIWWFIINLSSLLLIVISFLCYKHLSVLQCLKSKWFGQTSQAHSHSTEGQAKAGDEMVDVEAAITTTP